MKYIHLILIFVSLFLFACAKEGDLTLVNRTNHNIYYTIQNRDYTLTANQTAKHTFSVGNETLFKTAEKEIPIKIEGETFILLDEDIETNETSVNIKGDENLKVFLYPTHAGLKIVNHSNKIFRNLIYKQHFVSHTHSSDDLLHFEELNPQDSLWVRIPYSFLNPDNPYYFYYTFEVRDTDGFIHTFGDSTTVLDKDIQYRIELTD